MARMQPATARLSGSVGDSLLGGGGLALEVMLRMRLIVVGFVSISVGTTLAFLRDARAGPENQTLRVLRDIRATIKSMEGRFDKRFDAADGKNGRPTVSDR
jgi:hypothetical protein